jgi:chemosensory pili system protein ChpA (sensor histidine kinase/response regulator)
VHELTLLDVLLNLPPDRRRQNRNGFPVLIVKTDTGAARAIQVQDLLESRELVMKNLGRYVPHIPGIAGAAILGDGSVAPVIDLPELLRTWRYSDEAVAIPAQPEDSWVSPKALSQRVALVVDDSLSARRATAQCMKDAGFVVRMAGDGLEAVSVLEKLVPDIILVDMEMPRMNGLELTSHVRAREQTKHVPVIMITSRSTEKHRQQAETAGVNVYLTKPFNDELLLQHVAELTERKK